MNLVPGTAGTILPISRMSQGVTNGQRVGLDVQAKSLQIRWFAENISTAVQIARLVVFRWTDNDPPIVANILALGVAGAANYAMAPFNPLYRPKYKILYDRFMVLNHDVGVGTNQAATANCVTHGIVRKKLGFKQTYIDDLSTNGEKNRLYVLTISSSASTSVGYEPMMFYYDS